MSDCLLFPVPLVRSPELRALLKVVDELVRLTEFEATARRVLTNKVTMVVRIEVIMVLTGQDECINFAELNWQGVSRSRRIP